MTEEFQMNAKKIVEEYLKTHGYGGLRDDTSGCKCRIDSLFQCAGDYPNYPLECEAEDEAEE